MLHSSVAPKKLSIDLDLFIDVELAQMLDDPHSGHSTIIPVGGVSGLCMRKRERRGDFAYRKTCEPNRSPNGIVKLLP